MRIKVGSRIQDMNPTWPNFLDTGTVIRIVSRGRAIEWKSDKTGEILIDKITDIKLLNPKLK